ncbi:O-acyltransferase like protein [Denticeps clupeoides]|uniref:O-acyltransferase like protein n=1 Tax=Denticeps clupeoides TaxID=299321 RepID=UPI0010A32942|nr:O-acyltransferase like protein-like [Denticeps clupeoides]
MSPAWTAFSPYLLFSIAQAFNVSQKCMQDTTTFLLELSNGRPAKYAAMMYDAFGKLGSDVQGGNVNRPGSLRECQSVHTPDFSGRYCQVFLKQEPVQYFVGICVPDSCAEDEVHKLVICDVFHQGSVSLIPPVPPVLLTDSTLGIFMTECLTRSPTLDGSAAICLSVCCVLVAAPLAATVYVALINWRRQKEVSPASEINSSLTIGHNQYGTLASPLTSTDGIVTQDTSPAKESQPDQEIRKKSTGCLFSCLCTLSLQGSGSGLLNSGSSNSYSSLNGIRILSLLWIISGHNVQLSAWNNLDNGKRWKETVERNPLYIFAFSGPVYLAVDTFLLLGGLLSAKSLLGSIQRSDNRLSPGLLAHFLFKRFKRVQPLHLFIVCLAIGLFSVVQKGAFWFISDDEVLNCKRYWWSNLLLVNNLFTITDICAPWTWYLSIDFQFYATTPVLIFLYRLNKSVLVLVTAVLLVGSSAFSAMITASLHLPVHQPTTLVYKSYFQYYYNKPYTRYGPYLVGILAGIYMTTKDGQLLKHQWQAAVGWICSLSVMFVVVTLAYTLMDVPPRSSLPHAVYQGLHRTLWALAVAWIILACEEGYGGFVDKILSLNIWVPLSNISFACYLVHPILIILYNGQQETPIHYTNLNFFYLFMGHVVLTLMLGFALTLLIEKPYLFLKANKG